MGLFLDLLGPRFKTTYWFARDLVPFARTYEWVFQMHWKCHECELLVRLVLGVATLECCAREYEPIVVVEKRTVVLRTKCSFRNVL